MALVSRGVNLALAQANATGALPSLTGLNTLLQAGKPEYPSILATLTLDAAPASFTDSLAAFQAQTPLSGSRANQGDGSTTSLDNELFAAQSVLDSAQLFKAYYLISGIGFTLRAASSLVNDSAVANSLDFAGFELLTVANLAAAAGSQVQVNAAQRVLQLESAEAQPGPESCRNTDPRCYLSPEFIYGTWQANTSQPLPTLILYQFKPSHFLKVNQTGEQVETEFTPGTLTALVNYLQPGQEDVRVSVLVEKSNGRTLRLDFQVPEADPGTPSGAPAQLVETSGARQTFVKVP